MSYQYGNSWQNRPDEGEGGSWSSRPSNSPVGPTVRRLWDEKAIRLESDPRFVVTFYQNFDLVEEFDWAWETWLEADVSESSQWTPDSCSYYWVKSIDIDSDAKTITVWLE